MSSDLKGRERRDFWILTLAQFQMFCGFFSFFVFPLYIKSVGGNEAAIGLMGGLGAFAATLFIPWIADFVNRSERKLLMQIGMAMTGICTLGGLTMSAPDWWMAILVVMRGLGFALYNNAAGAYIAEILPPGERSRWIGMNFGFNQIAVAVGPALGELLIVQVGFTAFFLMGALFTASAMIWLTQVTTRQPRMALPRTGTVETGRVFFATILRRDTRYLYLTLLLMACGLGAVFNFTATYVKGIGISSGVFFVIYALVNGGSRMGGGGLSDRYGRAVIIIPTLSIFALGLMIYSVIGGFPLMAVSAICIGLGFGLSNPSILAQLLDRAGPSEQGRIVGGFHFCYQVGALCATPIFGVIAEEAGYPSMWRVAGLLVIASTAVYALKERREQPVPRQASMPEKSSA